MLDAVDFGRNPEGPEFGEYGVTYVRSGKAKKGSPPERRSVLTVFDRSAEILQQRNEELRPLFPAAGSGAPYSAAHTRRHPGPAELADRRLPPRPAHGQRRPAAPRPQTPAVRAVARPSGSPPRRTSNAPAYSGTSPPGTSSASSAPRRPGARWAPARRRKPVSRSPKPAPSRSGSPPGTSRWTPAPRPISMPGTWRSTPPGAPRRHSYAGAWTPAACRGSPSRTARPPTPTRRANTSTSQPCNGFSPTTAPHRESESPPASCCCSHSPSAESSA
ncbi:hypothetical protein HDA42_007464 [Streptomyces costaricanus]|uniref:Uncharacterized protein n=1 Tax=Streptomyces murinus TaxID=33900 RepID=A0A7W3NX13_STRMR|nr:hypothetical protein [Streptomyces murinus]